MLNLRRLLCIYLALVILFISLPFNALATGTDPTAGSASDLQGATPVSIDANSAVASALIGAGVQPGTELTDFNMLVSSCVTALEADGMFTDGKIAFISNTTDDLQYMYAPIHLIDAVRNWLLDDSGAVSDSLLDSGSFTIDSSSYTFYVTQSEFNSIPANVFSCIGTYLNSVGRFYICFLCISDSPFSVHVSNSDGTYSVYNASVPDGGINYVASPISLRGYTTTPFFGLPQVDFGQIDTSIQYAASVYGFSDFSTSLDLYLGDLSSEGFSSWLGNSVTYDGGTFVPSAIKSTYDDTITLPQGNVQSGISDYVIPVVPDVTVPDWETPTVPEYPGSDAAPADNELLWGIRVAVTETIPYWIKTTSTSIVQWLQKIWNNITDSITAVVSVISTNHDALMSKLDELKSSFGGDSAAGDDLQAEIDRIDSELGEMSDIMDSVTRPPVDDINTDISEQVPEADLTLLTTPFTTILSTGPLATMTLVSLTLVLCAYVLYGKR